MPNPSFNHHPITESSTPVSNSVSLRPSLFDIKDDFVERMAPLGVAAIYFGGFSLAPQDASLACQALFKLSFLHRHFLQPGGLRITMQRQTALLSGEVTVRALVTMADILARQIEGIHQVKNETETADVDSIHAARESIRLLFATDQTLHSGVQVNIYEGRLVLEGEVKSDVQKNWAEQLAETVIGKVDSRIKLSTFTSSPTMKSAESPQVDDESLQTLVLFRLRLARDTEHLSVKVKASRSIVTLQGKVRNEALRQRAEKLARSTLGLRELRSALSIAA